MFLLSHNFTSARLLAVATCVFVRWQFTIKSIFWQHLHNRTSVDSWLLPLYPVTVNIYYWYCYAAAGQTCRRASSIEPFRLTCRQVDLSISSPFAGWYAHMSTICLILVQLGQRNSRSICMCFPFQSPVSSWSMIDDTADGGSRSNRVVCMTSVKVAYLNVRKTFFCVPSSASQNSVLVRQAVLVAAAIGTASYCCS